MISVVGRSSTLASALKATTSSVNSSGNGIITCLLETQTPKVVVDTPVYKFKDNLLKSGTVKVSSGIGVTTQVRFAHSDLQIPNFDHVRRPSTLDPTSDSKDSIGIRNGFTYMIATGGLIATSYVAKNVAAQVLSVLAPSADVLALSKIEIKIGDIPEGKSMTYKWRGKPIFVRHRTDTEISEECAVDISALRDPEHDKDRAIDPKYLVVIGVCTHLGCVPIANAGEWGGYYCPCHGSHYDASGRIRKGPAPLNLEVPQHTYPEPGLLIIG